MTMRPRSARWFELLVDRDDLTAALDRLAHSARVELQSHGDSGTRPVLPGSRELLEEYDVLARRYRPYWPPAPAYQPEDRAEPMRILDRAVAKLRAWARAAAEPIEQFEQRQRERADLELLLELLSMSEPAPACLDDCTRAGPLLRSCLYLLAPGEHSLDLPTAVIAQQLRTPAHEFLLAVGLPEDIEELENRLQLQKAKSISLPPGLPGTVAAATDWVVARIAAVDADIARLRDALRDLEEQFAVGDTVARVRFVRWYADSVPKLESTEHFAWITGWTSDEDEESLLRLLADADIKALLRVAEAPHDLEAPQLLSNPPWLRPFEFFTRMLGMPAAGEADPTRVVAIAGPLMFGYMFGDVGHGAVLLVIGLLASRHYPALRLLAAGGAASIVFGFLFGSVFALETVIPALWLHPMQQPLLVFAIPMAGGAILLLTGMILDAMQAYWQRRARFWWASGAGLLLCYAMLLGSLRWLPLLWAAAFGASWFVVGQAFVAQGQRLAAIGNAAVELLESLLQLLVNTVSFVRVGAFALAHAGLSLAVVGVADAAPAGVASILIMVVGNLLIIGLEGLVVSIQTTRLVLFEFFVRFLRAEGRPFRPMLPAAPGPIDRQGRPT